MVSCYLAALKTCTSPKLDLYTGGLLLAGIRFERESRRPVFGRVHSKVRLFSTKCYTTGGCQDLSRSSLISGSKSLFFMAFLPSTGIYETGSM